jgi:cytochrome c oxidase subunit 2
MRDPLRALCEDPLERRWVWLTFIMAFVFSLILGLYALNSNIHPPSNVETIDSSRLHLDSEFSEDNIGVQKNADGSYTVRMVAARYGFYPQVIEVPEQTPIKFRMASADVLHGVHVPFTNAASMLVPGYVSEFETVFPAPGTHAFLCNEYCGLGHDSMWSRLIVTPKTTEGGKS